MEDSLVGGLISDIESEALVIVCARKSVLERHVLKMKGPPAEPVMLRHSFDEQGFGWRGGCMLTAKAFEELIELFLLFPGKYGKCAGEAVAEIVAHGCGEAFGRFWTRGVLRVGLIGCDLSRS